MAEIYKVQIEDESGNIHYPHTAADVVFLSDGKKAEQVIKDLDDKKHTHGNKTVIDKITQALLDNWTAAYTHVSDAVKHVTAAERTNWNTVTNKVDKVSGKQLSTNDYTAAEKTKLAGIATGAEVNVQSDWNATNTAADAYIKNKPTSMPASDVSAWAKAPAKPSYGWTEITGKPNTYTPAAHTHAASQVTQDATHRFATDAEKAKWNEIDEVKQSLEKYASITVAGELLNLPGGGDIAVTSEILTIPLRI